MNNRELAVLVWLSIGLAWALTQREIRLALWRVIVCWLHPKMVGTVLALGVYTLGLIWLGAKGGLWDKSMPNETVIWFVSVALVLHLNSNRVSEDRHFLQRSLRRAVGGTVFLEGFVNLFVLPLGVELVLFPCLLLSVALATVAETRRETATVSRMMNGVIAVIGVGLISSVVAHLVLGFGDLDWIHLAQVLILPVWLTAGVLPAVFILGLYAACDSAFRRVDFFGEKLGSTRPAQWRAKLALLLATRLRPRVIGGFAGPWMRPLVSAASFKEAREIVVLFQGRQDEEDAFLAAIEEPA